MTSYRIYCVNHASYGNHHHIESVGARDRSGVAHQFTVQDVYRRINAGDDFYVIGTSTGKRSEVGKYRCTQCLVQTIRSSADDVLDNNLDTQNPCPTWFTQ